ncbi:MFT2-Corn MFT-like protein [Chytridiales sp. JEL 0842]|nr:MFT2-Corn MFT-like protein [Chytridiales sp. JEL 0842]
MASVIASSRSISTRTASSTTACILTRSPSKSSSTTLPKSKAVSTTNYTQSRHVTIGFQDRLERIDITQQQSKPKYTPPPVPSNLDSADPLSKVYTHALSILSEEQASMKSKTDSLKAKLSSGSLSPAERSKLEEQIRHAELILSTTDLFQHWSHYSQGPVASIRRSPASASQSLELEIQPPSEAPLDPKDVDPFKAYLKRQRYETVVLPKLLKAAERHGIFVDGFPGKDVPEVQKPKVNVQVNFQNTEWEGCIGHPVPPNWALYSPEVVITTTDGTSNPDAAPKYYTLLLSDLDHPNPDTASYQEWAHWLVTDIPVQNELVIPFGTSPFLRPASSTPAIPPTSNKGAGFHPVPPTTEPKIPGNMVLPYLPPHPPNSNPRKVHRYLLTVFEQKEKGAVQIDLGTLKAAALREREAGLEVKRKALAMQRRNKSDGTEVEVPAWEKKIVGEREEELLVLERGQVPTWGLRRAAVEGVQGEVDSLSVAGWAFFTSGWNLYTPEIYTRLGIHEPVYGQLRNATDLVHKIANSTSVAQSLIRERLASLAPKAASTEAEEAEPLATSTLASLEPRSLNALNSGSVAPAPRFRLPTRLSLEAEKLQEAHLKSVTAKQAGGEGKKKAKAAAAVVVEKKKTEGKLPRLTVLGTVGLVRAKEGGEGGELTKNVVGRRGRYVNV